MKLDKKQKIMIPLVILAFAFVGWQAYKLLGGGDGGRYTPPADPVQTKTLAITATAGQRANNNAASANSGTTTAAAQTSAASNNTTTQQPSPTATNANTVSNNQPSTQQGSLTTSASNAGSQSSGTKQSGSGAQSGVGAQSSGVKQTQEPLTPETKAQLAQQKALERQYVQMVTQYQLAQMQKKLADVNAQLAQSKLREAQAVAKASSQNVGVGSLAGAAASSITSRTLGSYSLLYVGHLNHQWMATLRYAGQLHNVHMGSQFADGTTVKVIDRNGVVLTNGTASRYLMISVPMTLTDDATAQTQKAAQPQRGSGGASSDTNAKTTQSAQQVYNTLSQIQQAVPQ